MQSELKIFSLAGAAKGCLTVHVNFKTVKIHKFVNSKFYTVNATI
jgi:hypothetical protein